MRNAEVRIPPPNHGVPEHGLRRRHRGCKRAVQYESFPGPIISLLHETKTALIPPGEDMLDVVQCRDVLLRPIARQ
jgi:hypothetical protein